MSGQIVTEAAGGSGLGWIQVQIMPRGPPVHMIKLTETQEIMPYKWVHPDEER